MKISNRQAKKLLAAGKIKPTAETLQRRQKEKLAKDMSKAVVALESTSKSISGIGTQISKSVLKLANMSLKSSKTETKPDKKQKWQFTVLRDQKGFIKTIEAVQK